MKVSFVATVLNEEETIESFLRSIIYQSRIPDEVIIVDGGSTDRTVANIKYQILKIKNKKIRFKILVKKGNRAVGRNEAIENTKNEIIVCSDAGCVLDKNWVKNIIEPFSDSKVDVVAGYYAGIAKSTFEKCLTPYVLVMPDRVDANNFLPASRSLAFKKTIWKRAGGFDEKYSHNEDYVFAKKLKSVGANIVFAKKAIVLWAPRNNIKNAFVMFYRFAKGDSESRIFRPKVAMIFLRYLLGLSFVILSVVLKSCMALNALCLMLLVYLIWSISKNYKYVRDIRAVLFLPLLQFTSDLAVIMGTIEGYFFRYTSTK